MGSNHSRYEEYSSEHLKSFKNAYDRVKAVNDARFGQIEVFKNKTYHNLVMVTKRKFGSL